MNERPTSAESLERIGRLKAASPGYARDLERDPALGAWLEDPRNLRESFRFQAFLDTWAEFAARSAQTGDEARLGALRRWRRLMSMRIAHRSVNALADEPATVRELTLLAEFCLRECTILALRRWEDRAGVPWDNLRGAPARFCVLGLGKLGGRELNFSSDVDLIYFFDGDGSCRKDGVESNFSNGEYFTKVAEAVTRSLADRTADGFLFRTDLRLRPEGGNGPLVRSADELENYYSSAGQTWERLALVKARPVAGSLDAGSELLEGLHSFRYPRHPPPSLLEEVAAMKSRSDAELLGSDGLERDVKLGTGGIREIEFLVQSLQLLHAGRYPFLQTASTESALAQLARYGLIGGGDSTRLTEAYWFLRRTEHRLQIREEEQTHCLPTDLSGLESLSISLGFSGVAAFREALDVRRSRVHTLYADLFADRPENADFEDWWSFLTSDRTPDSVARSLARCFADAPDAGDGLRAFACGARHAAVTRETAVCARTAFAAFEGFASELAHPLSTLGRLTRFAESYGTRRRFLGFCGDNPKLFRIFSILFDRSEALANVLCAHPEILEEVLRPDILARRTTPEELDRDLELGARKEGFPDWLWLFVRAEQVRYALGGFLGTLEPAQIEAATTLLAEAVLRWAVRGSKALVVALGKFGGRELGFGSDLDLLFVAEDGAEAGALAAVDRVRSILGSGGTTLFALDLRLRPYGIAGPLVTSVAALDAYHRAEGGAQPWERLALVRARAVAGSPKLASAFHVWRERLLFSRPLSDSEFESIRAMRGRIETELGAGPAGAAFKAAAGGLADIEFLTQGLQLRHGFSDARLRDPGTRPALRALADCGILPGSAASALAGNYEFLRRIETALRLNSNQASRTLPSDADEQKALAHWMGFESSAAFTLEHLRRMGKTRLIFLKTTSHLEFGVPS